MSHVITAHFDGAKIVPDEPPDLPAGRRLRVVIELADDEPTEPQFAALLTFAVHDPDAPTDLAAQHDHYLYGTPKR